MNHHHVDLRCGLISNFPLFKSTILLLHSALLDFYPLSLWTLSFSLSCLQPSTKPDTILISIDLYVHPGARFILGNGGGIVQQVKLAGQAAVPKHVVKILISDPTGLVKDIACSLTPYWTKWNNNGVLALMNNVLKSEQLSFRLPVVFLSSFHVLFNFSLTAFNGCSCCWWGFS